MRPLKLAIEGFTAFRDRQEVDFEPLDLFVITGPTGAGKTSILDAMVFALYGQVPRLGGKHGTADLVSLGKVEARVQLDFAIAGKGRHRVARRLSRRTAQSATLERLEGESWVPVVERGGVRECDRVLRELLGLDFDSFCKAVVLPQGEFSRFLKGDPAERRQVLVSLLGVGYFQRMAEIARQRRTQLAAGVERTEEILTEQYADATPERVAQLRAEAGRANERSTALGESLKRAEEHARQAAGHDAQLRALAGREDELRRLEDALRDKVSECRAAEQEKTAAGTALREAAEQLAAHRRATAEAESAVTSLEAELGTVDRLAAVAAAADTAIAAAAEEQDAQAHHEQTERDTATATDTVEKAAAAEADARQAAESARTAATEHEQTTQRLEKGRDELARAISEAERRDRELAAARDRLDTTRAVAEGARADAERRRAELRGAVAHLEAHRKANAVAELASGLVAGDPCPVCASELEAPVAIAADVVETLETARAAQTVAQTVAEQADGRAARADADSAAAADTVRTCQLAASEALSGHANLPALQTEEQRARELAATAAAELARRHAARETCDAAERQARDRKIEAQGVLEGARRFNDLALSSLTAIRERRTRAMITLTDHFGGPAPDDAREQIAAQRARLTSAGDAARASRAQLDRVTQAHDTVRARADAADRELNRLDVELTRQRTQAETVSDLIPDLLGSDNTVSALPAAGDARDTATSDLAEWCTRAAAAMGTAREGAETARDSARRQVLAIASAHDIDAPSPEHGLELLSAAERTGSNAVVHARNEASQAERRAEEREQMERRVADEREQIAVLGDLALDLRADRFGEYIVQETLDLLAAHASEELLRISDGRYSLVPLEGDFHVVDHANADERRSVKTLSGGETFLASLALALALSRHVGELATEGLGAKLEAVFIDEGFGSLDPETLEEVIDALERLRAEELLVGVISHVPVLAERIRAGLEVRKSEGRSQIVQGAAA